MASSHPRHTFCPLLQYTWERIFYHAWSIPGNLLQICQTYQVRLLINEVLEETSYCNKSSWISNMLLLLLLRISSLSQLNISRSTMASVKGWALTGACDPLTFVWLRVYFAFYDWVLGCFHSTHYSSSEWLSEWFMMFFTLTFNKEKGYSWKNLLLLLILSCKEEIMMTCCSYIWLYIENIK